MPRGSGLGREGVLRLAVGRGSLFEVLMDRPHEIVLSDAFREASSPVMTTRRMGPVDLIVLPRPFPAVDLRRRCALDPSAVLVCIPDDRRSIPSGEDVVVLVGGSSDGAGSLPSGLVVVLSRSVSLRIRRAGVAPRPRPSPMLEIVARLASAASNRPCRASSPGDALVGTALCEVISASLLPDRGTPGCLSSRREATLLDRFVDLVESDPPTPVSVTSICRALGCSRSALYRATAPLGGVFAFLSSRGGPNGVRHGRSTDKPVGSPPVSGRSRG